jgi:hypothetical protein
MVPGAVHKDDHRAQAEEFELLRELIAEEPQVLWRGNRNPARRWQVAEELLSPNLAPKADPNTPSQMHRLLKVQGLIQIGGLPQFMGIADNRAIFKKTVEVLVGEDASEYELPPQPQGQPPPDPRIVAAQIKAQSEVLKGQQKQQEMELDHQARMSELQVESQDKAADRLAANQREAAKIDASHRQAGADLMQGGAELAHEAHQSAQQRQHEAATQSQQQQHDLTTQANEHMNQALQPQQPEGGG